MKILTKPMNFYGFSAFFAALLLAPELASAAPATGSTLGGVIDNLIDNTSNMTFLLSGFAYLTGLVFGFMAIMKFKDHVEDPRSTPIWDPMKRVIIAGSMFALPTIISMVIRLVNYNDNTDAYANSGWEGTAGAEGLDAKLVNLMRDVFEPAQGLFGWFGFIAGMFFVIIGIMRLMKTEEQGPRGPTGIGTIMTFVVAGCLFSLNAMIAYLSATLFGTSTIETDGVLQYSAGLNGAEAHVHAVIASIIAFAMLLGWISIIRGFFILRGVSEGNSQASMMAAMTHLIGGAMAVNLGPVIMAVQNTLGITEYGILF